MESRRRTLWKTLSWRIVATIITATVAGMITGELSFAIEIGLLDTTIKFLAYYLHERAWTSVTHGYKSNA